MQPRPPEDAFHNFECFDLTDPSALDRLIEQIKPELLVGKAYTYVEEEILRGKTFSNCKGAILEREYVDRDFLRGYLSFLGRSFSNLSRFTRRLHLFECPVTVDMLKAIDGFASEYIGFVVLRPTKVRTIGRTILKPPPTQSEDYFPTLARHLAHICGFEVSTNATVFMEQDSVVAACATVALWTSTTNIDRQFGLQLPNHSTADITFLATNNILINRVMPSDGLNYAQMAEALRSMGYDPLYFEIQSWRTVERLMFNYVESGIAPMLAIQLWNNGGWHAVTPIGFTYDNARDPQHPYTVTQGQYFGASQWISRFIVNDDQQGPYQTLSHINDTFPPVGSQDFLKRLTTLDSNLATQYQANPSAVLPNVKQRIEELPWVKIGEEYATIAGVFIPHPPRVSLTAVEAENKSLYVFLRFLDLHQIASPSNLVLKTYLIPSSKFQAYARQSVNLAPEVQDVYMSKPMPRWVWVTEISNKAMMSENDPDDRKIMGEVVLDATSDRNTADFLAIHYIATPDGNQGYLSSMMRTDETVADALGVVSLFPDAHYPSILAIRE